MNDILVEFGWGWVVGHLLNWGCFAPTLLTLGKTTTWYSYSFWGSLCKVPLLLSNSWLNYMFFAVNFLTIAPVLYSDLAGSDEDFSTCATGRYWTVISLPYKLRKSIWSFVGQFSSAWHFCNELDWISEAGGWVHSPLDIQDLSIPHVTVGKGPLCVLQSSAVMELLWMRFCLQPSLHLGFRLVQFGIFPATLGSVWRLSLWFAAYTRGGGTWVGSSHKFWNK